MTSVYTGANAALYLWDPPTDTDGNPAPVPGGGDGFLDWSKLDRAALVTAWSFTSSSEVLDITPLGDTDRTHVDGPRTLTGSMTIIYDYTAKEASKVLNKIIRAREGRGGLAKEQIGGFREVTDDNGRLVLRLALSKLTNIDSIPNDENDTVKYIQMRVMLTSVTMSAAVGAITTVEAQWQSNGAPEYIRM